VSFEAAAGLAEGARGGDGLVVEAATVAAASLDG
jgi:hypothetical protein